MTTTPDTTTTGDPTATPSGSWLPIAPAPGMLRGLTDLSVRHTQTSSGATIVELAHRDTPNRPFWVGDVADAIEFARAVLAVAAVAADASSRGGVS